MAGADGADSADVLIVGGWPASGHIEPRSSSRVQVSYRSLVGNATVATDVVPALRDVPLIRAWAGMTTATGRWNRLGFIGEDRRLGPGKFFVVVAGASPWAPCSAASCRSWCSTASRTSSTCGRSASSAPSRGWKGGPVAARALAY